MALLPRARLIFPVRDARDVIDSLMDAMSGGWLDEPHMGRLDTPEQRLAFARSRPASGSSAPGLSSEPSTHTIRSCAGSCATRTCERIRSGLCARSWMARYSTIRRRAIGGDRRQRVRGDSTCGEGSRDPARAATPGLWREHMSPEERRDRGGHRTKARRARIQRLARLGPRGRRLSVPHRPRGFPYRARLGERAEQAGDRAGDGAPHRAADPQRRPRAHRPGGAGRSSARRWSRRGADPLPQPGTVFFVDELERFVDSPTLRPVDVIEPHAGHLTAISNLVYKAILETVGALPGISTADRVLRAAHHGLFYALVKRRIGRCRRWRRLSCCCSSARRGR